MKRWRLLAVVLLAFAMNAFGKQTSYQDMVVMVDGKFVKNHPEFGAGIIVGESSDRTVIVTAAHIVESNDELASNIDVEFQSMRGRTFKASASRSYIDLNLDLAVIFVEKQSNSTVPQELDPSALDVVSPSKPSSLVNATVQVIGAMGKRRWATGVDTDRIMSATPDGLRLATDEAQAGASGGAVFDSLGRLLGMCSHVDSPSPQLLVIPMPTIMRQLERWGVPVSISFAKAGTASPELLAQIQSQLRIDVVYQKPAVYDPKQPLGDSAPNFPHRILAIMSPGIKALKPTVEITYLQVSGQTRKYVLNAPDYFVQAGEEPVILDGEVWVTFPDGRRLGPTHVKLDFESGPVAAATALGPKARDTLKWAREAIKTDEHNRLESEKRRRENQANTDANNREFEKRNTEFQRKQLLATTDRWSIDCAFKFDKWTCSYPLLYSTNVARHYHSFRMGSSETDLYIELPLGEDDEFRRTMVAETARILSSSDNISAIYVRAQLSGGEVIGPQAICHVVRYKQSDRAYCTNH
jgi:S1-C subfamily serine protease